MDYAVSFGRIGNRDRAAPGPAFRLALLGDFSGRASTGTMETGEALARRKPIKVDVDNLDAVVERLAPKLVLDLEDDGAVTVPIKSLDDFHPDQLVENIELFEQMLTLRKNLQSRAGFDRAAKQVLSWSGEEPLPKARRRGRGAAIPTDRKLSDFARLTGRKSLSESSADDLIRRLVGPYIVPARDARQDAMVAKVDEALSSAMRRVLHHPDFQAAEALWRSVEFLVRGIETGAKMQIVLYDVSAEELAADLAAADDLEQSGLFSMLVDQPAMDANQGPLTLLAGLYEFELTPPHADLLGRMAQVAASAGAPFVAGIGPDPLRTPQHDWHPLIQQAWTALRELPAAAYLGLATPRFLLRMPYGKRTDPIDPFAFEEFTREGGLSGMLWANPAVLVAQLVALAWAKNSRSMALGSVATVGDLPVYVYHDTDGDQIALPCTERLFSEKQAAQVAACGVMPVVSLRGRPEVRLTSFNAVGGKPLAGRWAPASTAAAAAAAAVAEAEAETETAASPEPEDAPASEESSADLDSLLAGLGTDSSSAPSEDAEAPAAEESGADLDSLLASLGGDSEAAPPAESDDSSSDLDALLASLNTAPEETKDGETEADLDALLASLK